MPDFRLRDAVTTLLERADKVVPQGARRGDVFHTTSHRRPSLPFLHLAGVDAHHCVVAVHFTDIDAVGVRDDRAHHVLTTA